MKCELEQWPANRTRNEDGLMWYKDGVELRVRSIGEWSEERSLVHEPK